ncbi:hypothetical protein CPter291_2637 [Collimonas pratensis]|uniref:DUF2845 domain-containing protein n=1 Tax=Collimonas pratensis TaxID=279113 RepID=A0ABM5Z6T0_9BURK|nr:hypothetical protein CPter291_2637 [Collimonas pratensis]
MPKNSSLDNSVIAATTPYTTSEVSKASNVNSSSSIEANTGSAAAEQNSSATTSDDETHWGRNIFLFFIIVIIAKWILNRRRKILLAEARAAHRLELLTKYRDENIVKKILARVIWIGETKEQLLDSLHSPEDIDVKAFKSKTQETWKYERTGKNRYALRVVLDDDIVVSYDDKR